MYFCLGSATVFCFVSVRYFILPTIITSLTDDSTYMQEVIFGECDIVLCDMVWSGVDLCCGVVCMLWSGTLWYDMAWNGMVWYGMVWCSMLLYGMV